jgi:hypothetical protein
MDKAAIQFVIDSNRDTFYDGDKMRAGKFTIARYIIDLHPDIALECLSGMIVVRAEMLYCSDMIEYVALSELFEFTDRHAIVPEYKLKFNSETKERTAERV